MRYQDPFVKLNAKEEIVRRVWIRCLMTVIFSFQFIVPVTALSASKVGQFILVNGDITLTRAGVMYKPAIQEDVQEGDVIQTGKNASVKVMLQDDTLITIDRNSRFIMKKFALRGGIRSAKIYLAFGKITADVKRFVGGRNTFDLESPTAVAGVSGTVVEFAVVIGVDEVPTTTVTCLSGSVVVTTAAGSVTLATGQTAVAVASIAPAVTTVTTAAAAAGTAGGTATTMTVGAGTIAIGAVIVAALVAAAVALSGGGGGGGGGGGNTLSGHTATTHH